MPDKGDKPDKTNPSDLAVWTPSQVAYLDALNNNGAGAFQAGSSGQGDWWDNLMGTLAPAITAAGAGALAGPAIGGFAATSGDTALTAGDLAAGGSSGLLGTSATEYGVAAGLGAGAVGGATKAGLTGGNVGQAALIGGVSGAVGGGISAGLSDAGVGSTTSAIVGKAGSSLTGLAANGITSPSGQSGGSVSTPSDQLPTTTGTGTGATPPAATSSGGNILSSLGSLVPSMSTIGNMAPYLAVGALGTYQANKGLANDQKYVNQLENLGQPALNEGKTLANKYNNNILSPQDANLMSGATTAVNGITQATSGLSSIAQTAFANFNSGTLPAWQQASLDAQTTAQKQQVAQLFASSGINDSTMLASANANIDNQALIAKGTLLQQNFATGTQALDEYLKGTAEGQSIMTNAVQTADTSLNAALTAAISSYGMGANIITNAIDTAMSVDANYSAQIAQLYGTLAAAYAKQQAGNTNTSNAGNAAGSAAGSAVGAAAKSAAGGAGGLISGNNSGTPNIGTDPSLQPDTTFPSGASNLGSLTVPDVSGATSDYTSAVNYYSG